MKKLLSIVFIVFFATINARLCLDFKMGNSLDECVTNCQAAGCDIIYPDGSSWCVDWCTRNRF